MHSAASSGLGWHRPTGRPRTRRRPPCRGSQSPKARARCELSGWSSCALSPSDRRCWPLAGKVALMSPVSTGIGLPAPAPANQERARLPTLLERPCSSWEPISSSTAAVPHSRGPAKGGASRTAQRWAASVSTREAAFPYPGGNVPATASESVLNRPPGPGRRGSDSRIGG